MLCKKQVYRRFMIRLSAKTKSENFFAKNNIQDESLIKRMVKSFDLYFLQFISFRKQRDLLITNTFFRYLLQNVNVDKNFKKDNGLSEFFSVKKGALSIDDELLPISIEEINKGLQMQMEILKTFYETFDKYVNNSGEVKDKFGIDAKINKVKALTDEAIMQRLTKSKDIVSYIFSKVGKIKVFDKISSAKITLPDF